MSFHYLVGSGYNYIARASLAPTPDSADAKHPITRLSDGFPGQAFIFGAAGNSIKFDLNESVNGGHESAFVGGFPGAGWGKSSGATLARSTAQFLAGVASLEVTGANQYAYFDQRVSPGDVLSVTSSLKAATGAITLLGMLKCRNMETGKWLGPGFTWQVGETFFGQNPANSAAWQTFAGTFTVEDYAACLVDRPVLRWYFVRGNESGSTFFDEFYVWTHPTFASVHGHTYPAGTALIVRSTAVDATARAVVATFSLVHPSTFVTFASNGHRFWTLDGGTGAPDARKVAIGEAVLGRYGTLLRKQDAPFDTSVVHPQDRSESDLGPLQAFVRTDRGRRRLSLRFRSFTEAQYLQRKEIWERSRNGADPLLLVPDSADPASAMICRTAVEQKVTRHQHTSRRDYTWELDELPFPTVLSA